jgi:hypothetical protein
MMQIIRRFLALWATREPDAMASLWAMDGIYDNLPNNQPLRGARRYGNRARHSQGSPEWTSLYKEATGKWKAT